MSILVILAPIDRVSPSFSKILEYSSILKNGDWDAVLGNSCIYNYFPKQVGNHESSARPERKKEKRKEKKERKKEITLMVLVRGTLTRVRARR
jgi:hypothetical protein